MGHARPRWHPRAARDAGTESAWPRVPTRRANFERSEPPRPPRGSQGRRPKDAPSRQTRHARPGRIRELDDKQLAKAVKTLYNDQLKP